jgi:glycosyltransferase involved in cell wall biosynthesis
MKLLILSQYYKPEPIPKPSDLAEQLSRKGHSVSVVTGLPNYPAGVLYPGFRLGLVQRETLDGVKVVRTFELPYHGKSSIGRMLNYLTFMITAPFGSFFVPRCDVMYVWHPPLTVGVAAWLIARLHGIPFIYDVQDIWPESVVLSGMVRNKIVIRMLSMLERFIYRRADHIFVVTRGARENLLEKGVNPEKVSVMPHWIDETKSAPIDTETRQRIRQTYGWTDKFVILFAGNIGMVQGLDAVVRAAALLPQGGGFLISLIGDGADRQRLRELAKSLDVDDRIEFVDRHPAAEMPALMEASDALLVHLKSAPMAHWVIPTKIFAYLSAAKPILVAMEGAAADLVRDSGAGIVVPPSDAAALAQAICRLRDLPQEDREAMGRRGREYLVTKYSMQTVIAQYEQKLQTIAAAGKRGMPAPKGRPLKGKGLTT